VGPAEQPLLREIGGRSQAQRRARQAAPQGSRRDQSELHAHDADRVRRAAHRAGGADPDANLHQFLSCKGPLNGSGYCQNDVEARINEARTSLDPKQRAAAYEKIAQQVAKDRPIIYLYHRNWLWAHNAKLTGLRTVPDGMVRVQGLRMN
jgi:ABC-type transport system substrate-binding protein